MSILKLIKTQLGMSTTPTNNFTITAESANGTMKLARGNPGATTQDILTVDTNGRIAMPNNVVAFRAKNGATQGVAAALTKVNLPFKDFDTTNAFDTTTSRFTPTVAGYYQINCVLRAGGSPLTNGYVQIHKNGNVYSRGNELSGTGMQGVQFTHSDIVYLNGIGDYIEMIGYVAGTNSAFNHSGNGYECWMSGYLLGKA